MVTPSNHELTLKFNEIPINLRSGIGALKWPEHPRKPPIPTTVHLSIDAKGFYLICRDNSTKTIECFDLALIHDTRTGSQVSLPPEAERCPQFNTGILDTSLTSKCLTLYYGYTFVHSSDLRIIHFSFESSRLAQEWTEPLFRYGHNQLLRNLSSLDCLEKIHTKIVHSLLDFDQQTIPVRSLIHFLCHNVHDNPKEEKICRILGWLKLPHEIDSAIDPKQFTFNVFFRLYMHLMEHSKTRSLFGSMTDKHPGYLHWEDIQEFLKKQDDTRDDPFGMDSYEQKARDLMRRYTQHDEHLQDGGMNNESFLRYLLSFDNLIIDPRKFGPFMDMTKPLAHYFISSSHNTYLTGSQLHGNSSVEMYRQVLLTGCRCIELDVVDSADNSAIPEIRHIRTLVRPVLFIDVIVAIRDYAFKVTSYPLILSIENHCHAEAQATMARYFVDIFGDSLITQPLASHPCDERYPLPSPKDLKNKILIKNKKLHPHATVNATNSNVPTLITHSSSDPGTTTSPPSASSTSSPPFRTTSNGSLQRQPAVDRRHRYGVYFDDDNSSDGECRKNSIDSIDVLSPNSDALPESNATKAMSDLVWYIVPVRFKTFAHAQELHRSFEMSSFSEDKGQSLIRVQAKDFLIYNQRQISRIYPRGTRVMSDNYNPYIFWPIGCQMVALNYQTLDVPMQLNLGLFSYNNACGYIEKPSILCQSRSLFDPNAQRNIENVAGYDINIKILSGQFLCQNRPPTFVDIQIYGTYGDINKRHEYRVRAKHWNGFQAIYDETNINELPIRFAKIILPEMAALRFAVSTDDGVLIGQSFLPITYLRPGYRHVVLRNAINIPVRAASLFVFIQKKISVNAKDQELADLLDNPSIVQTPYFNNEPNYRHHSTSDIDQSVPYSFLNKLRNTIRGRSLPPPFSETNWYQKHVIAGSQFNERKRLSKVLSLNDTPQEEILQRDQSIHKELRRTSIDYKKRIQKATNRLQKYSIDQDDGLPCHRHRSKSTTSEINKQTDIEQAEQSLLDLYSEKLHYQEDLECKYLNQYYDKIERNIRDDYNNQLRKLNGILRKEKGKVEDDVRFQTKQEADAIKLAGLDRDRTAKSREESSRMNIKTGASTIHMLEQMYEQVKELLQDNFQRNLDQLNEQKSLEIEKCCEKYIDQFHRWKIGLQRQMHSNEDDNPPDVLSSSDHPRMASASQSTEDFWL